MPRPGTNIEITDAGPVGGAILDTGQGFHLGLSQRGPVDAPARLRSLREYERVCGSRAGGISAHDSARAFFTEGGSTLYFGRLVGEAATGAEATVGPLEAHAVSPGEWGNAVTVALEVDGGLAAAGLELLRSRAAPPPPKRKRTKAATRADDDNGDEGNGDNGNGETPEPEPEPGVRVVVTVDGRPAERSSLYTTAEQAVGWARTSAYVRLEADDPEAELEVVDAVALSGGADDEGVGPDTVRATLARFEYGLGPGQVSYPGNTDPEVHAAILEHCDDMRRCALLDGTDSGDPTYLAADALERHPHAGARFAALLAPRILYPGPAPGTNVLVPFSAIQGGVIARNDAATGNPNQPAAGTFGIIRQARGLGHDFTDDEREALNELGVTLAQVRQGTIRTYGSRTVAGPGEPNWTWFGGSRVVMAIAHEADAVAENFVHRQIDGRRLVFARLNAELREVCLRYFALDALYGETPEEAFRIDTGEDVNTLETIRAGEIHGIVWLKCSPPGEWVAIELAKTAIEMSLAA